jgi:iron(III) transport system substrate-binding protein
VKNLAIVRKSYLALSLLAALSVGVDLAAAAAVADIANYRKSDRQKILEDGARREGQLLWYTSLIIKDRARPQVDAFRKRYPFINVDIVRLDSAQMIIRVAEEYKAGRHDVDFFEASFPAMVHMRLEKILQPFWSPQLDAIPKEYIAPDRSFAGDRMNPLGLAYNTNRISKDQAPRTFEDLLTPKWKSQISTQDTSQAIQYMGAVLNTKGLEYVKRLAQQDVTVYSMSSRAVVNLVVSGEAVMTLPASVGHVMLDKQKAAPVEWVALEPVPTAQGYVALASKPPHPHAAMLFIDFLLSEEGQQIYVKTEEGAVRKGVTNPFGDFKKFSPDFAVPLEKYDDTYRQWEKLHSELFIKRIK